MQQTVARNTTYLTVAYVLQKIISFVYFILIAKFIGVENLGKYTFALSFTTMFAMFVDMGLTGSLIRESAKKWEKAGQYLSSIIGIKVFFALLVYAVVAIAINLLGYPPVTKSMVYLSGFIMVLDSFTLSFWGLFRGGQNLKYEGLSVIINQIIVIIIGTVVLLLRLPLPYLMLPFLFGSIFSLVFSNIMIIKKLQLKYSFKLDKDVLKFLFSIAVPLALIAIFSRIYGYIDQILLSYISGDIYLGWYAAAMKIPFALQFIPSAFAAAVFPAFSYYYLHDKKQLKISFDKAMMILMMIAIPITFGIFSVSEEAINLAFGVEYANSILPLKILCFGMLFVFLNFPLGSLLNGCDKQVSNTKLVGSVMVINIILNVILIPKYNFIGSSVAFLICHFILFVGSMIVANKIIPYSKRLLFWSFVKSVVSAVIMAAMIIYFKQYIHFTILVALGAVVYFGLLYLQKGYSKQEVQFLIQQFKRSKK